MAAPTAPTRVTNIPEPGSVLGRVVRHLDPFSIDEHLHARQRHPVRRRPAILVVVQSKRLLNQAPLDLNQAPLDIVWLSRG